MNPLANTRRGYNRDMALSALPVTFLPWYANLSQFDVAAQLISALTEVMLEVSSSHRSAVHGRVSDRSACVSKLDLGVFAQNLRC